ncbi:MAG: SiaB family protein kinase [Bacteroidales bacterium]|nr:SiaB family protein kinase [Bacteroidales bacterium]
MSIKNPSMELDKNFMRNVLSLYDELIDNGISVVYIGKFTHQVVKMFTEKNEEEMEQNNEEKQVKRRVHHSLVEILQNMQKHSTEFQTEFSLINGLFMIGRKDGIYYIMTANKVTKHDIMHLSEALECVNNATKDELNAMYKKQLKEGKISSKGGAGLGLIDIARKTDGKLEYLFIPVNGTDYFILKVEISGQGGDE